MLYPDELRAPILASSFVSLAVATNGRGRGIRTHDPLLPKQVRYQAALYPDIHSNKPQGEQHDTQS